jgi:membrane peptidoglycan carboxypeptidase
VVAEAPGADPGKLRGAAEHTFPDGSRAVVGPGVGDWVALGELPAHVDGAFRAAEDEKFFEHRGFDEAAIARSFEVDLREGRFARGGSTISQQLVKNEWLTMRRTLDRKVQEAVLTWRLESVLPKRVILERYLNEIELGPGVFGVGAAARWWFGKPAKELKVREAALLAAMTAEPKTMSARIAAAGGVDRETDERVETVLRQMRRAGVIDRDELDRAKDERIELRREALKR